MTEQSWLEEFYLFLRRNIIYTINTDRAIGRVFLCIAWLAGLFFGIILANGCSDTVILMIRSAGKSGTSMVNMFALLLFPLFVSAFFIWLSKPFLVILLVSVKAFLFGFSAMSVTFAFGDAGWLTRWLLLFSDSCSSVVLFWFWIRNVFGEKRIFKRDFVCCVALIIALGCFDYYIVSPFSVTLFNY